MITTTRKDGSRPTLFGFDYAEPAEVFGGSSWSRKSSTTSYRRFETSAEALRFVIEDLDEIARRSCIIEINEQRFNYIDARKLYESKGYPLPRERSEDANAT